VRENWTGKASEDFDAVVRAVTAKMSGVLQFLQNPGYGATLRAAGDRLADHQQRFRDLQGQKAQQDAQPPAAGAPSPEETAKVNDDSAKQILRDLRTAYWDVGNALTPLPYKPPQVVADTSGDTKNGEHSPGNGSPNPGGTHPNGNQFFGPGGAPPPLLTKTATTTRSGSPGGDDRFRFTGQSGPDAQVLGRGDQGGQSFGGPGPGAPFMPGQRGSVFFAGGSQGNGPAVLGQKYSVTARQEPLEQAEDEAAAAAFGAVAPAVLGRSASRSGTCRPESTTTSGRTGKEKDGKRKTAEESLPVAETLAETRPETVSAETVDQPAELPAEERSNLVRTAVDAPSTLVADKAHELVAQAATTSGQPLVATQGVTTEGVTTQGLTTHGVTTHGVTTHAVAGTPLETAAVSQVTSQAVPHAGAAASAATPAEAAKHAVPAALELGPDAKRSFALSASGLGGGGGVTHAVALDPHARGMSAPGTTTPDGLTVPVEPTTGAAAQGASGRAATDPYASQHMGGFPMSGMMMGGMGGMGGQQNNGRMAALPNEPRPEVWDPATGAPIAVGKREQEKEQPQEREPELSREEVRAALTEKFAELDRLMERGK
ncbi:MAG: hypothetical protein ACJ73U_06875, partial [Actinophytocola sp.]